MDVERWKPERKWDSSGGNEGGVVPRLEKGQFGLGQARDLGQAGIYSYASL